MLVPSQYSPGSRPDQRLEAEQIVHQLDTAEHRPHSPERRFDVGEATKPSGQLGLPFLGWGATAREHSGGRHVDELLTLELELRLEFSRSEIDVASVHAYQRLPELLDQMVDDESRDKRTPLVVRAATLTSALDDPGALGVREPQPMSVEGHEEIDAETRAPGQRWHWR